MPYGWYSQKAADQSGTITYTTPDGGTVIVTHVTDSDRYNPERYRWSDTVSVGKIVKCINSMKLKNRYPK